MLLNVITLEHVISLLNIHGKLLLDYIVLIINHSVMLLPLCSVSVPHGTVGLSVVCGSGIVGHILTFCVFYYSLILQHTY